MSRFGRGFTTAVLGITIGLFANGVGFNPSISVPPAEATASPAGHLASSVASRLPEVSHDVETSNLESLERRFQSIADRVAPGVVAISAAVDAIDADDLVRAGDLNPQKLQAALDRTTRIVGTGFVIDPDGYILTNEHVIGDAEQLWVTTDDHRVLPAIVVGSDPRSDLAVLKVPATNLPAVRFADYGSVARGQWTIALGNPYGLAGDGEMCMSVGIVSATDRSLPKLSSKENRLYSNLIQTTAEINPGNSGGPLFDLDGDVIGINTAVILPQKSTNGIGFAVPITPQVMACVQKLKQGDEIVYGYLGVTVSNPTARLRQELSLSNIGARIDTIESDSPAGKGDLRPGDVVIEVNGELVRDADHFVRLIGFCPVDVPARMSLYRDGNPINVDAPLRKRQLPTVAVTRESQRLRWRGMLLGPVPAHWNDPSTRPQSGLIVLAVSSTSPMVSQGVKPGDILATVAGRPVTTIPALHQLINETDPSEWTVQLANAGPAITSAAE